MGKRFLAFVGGVATVIAAASLAAVSVAGQAQTNASKTASKPAAAAKVWTPRRTSWGDPDLQGNYTNKYEQGTPFESRKSSKGGR